MKEVILAKSAGFCFGVQRAMDTVYAEADKKNVYTYGPIIHNTEVVNELESKGVKAVNDISEIPEPEKSTVIIRSHGVSKAVYESIKNSGSNDGGKGMQVPVPITEIRGYDGSVTKIDCRYASHYRRGGMQTADKIEAVAKLLGKSGMVGGDQIADVAHGLKYFARAGLKDDYDLDIYKCADWLHRLITGQFLNEVEDESGSWEK